MSQNNKKAPKTQMVFDFNTPKGREEAVEKFLKELHKQTFAKDEAMLCSYKGCTHSLGVSKGTNKTVTECLAHIIKECKELVIPAMTIAALAAEMEDDSDK